MLTVVTLWYSAVDNTLTSEDLDYIKLFQPEVVDGLSLDYEDQIKFINSVLVSVSSVTSDYSGIPLNQSREPKDLHLRKSGLCYDRSRVIEKILRFNKFKVRHVSIFSLEGFTSKVRAMLTRGISSHAVSEVLTNKGWMLLGSNNVWMARVESGDPLSVADIQARVRSSQEIGWFEQPHTDIYEIDFVFFYGFYSRHGRFYPPFNPVPDINYSEFMDNFF
jgi:hypothetical protein